MKVFLSHASTDKPLVRKVCESLDNIAVWYDEIDIVNGDNIPRKISDGIESATHFALFWSKQASMSEWVNAELGAAFMQRCASKCRFLLFVLDDTDLPAILKPIKYLKVSNTDLDRAAIEVVDCIKSADSQTSSQDKFVNRLHEIGDIERSKNENCKLISITGISGIGKHSLAIRTTSVLFSNRKPITINLRNIGGLPELCIEIASALKVKIQACYENNEVAKAEMEYLLEYASTQDVILIFKDAKGWLTDSAELSRNLAYIVRKVVETDLFVGAPVIITSTRFIKFPQERSFIDSVHYVRLGALEEAHTATAIKNHLYPSFRSEHYDYAKTLEIATKIYGYPLAAKHIASLISVKGYDYMLGHEFYIKSINASFAKEVISLCEITSNCDMFLRLLALTKSALFIKEISDALGKKEPNEVLAWAEEAYSVGLVDYSEGRYCLDNIVADMYYDKAFSDVNRQKVIKHIVNYLLSIIPSVPMKNPKDYARIVPIVVHLLVLDNRTNEALLLRRDMLATILASAWEQYNHMQIDAAYEAVRSISGECSTPSQLEFDIKHLESLCLMRREKYLESLEIVKYLRSVYGNSYLLEFLEGRIYKLQDKCKEAIPHYLQALNLYAQHASSLRDVAECYFRLKRYDVALGYIRRAKTIDQGNPFVVVLESRILTALGQITEALAALENPVIYSEDGSLIEFQRGRIYDILGNDLKAKEHYRNAVMINPQDWDARLCLLNHSMSKDSGFKEEAESLRKQLNYKRLRILTNIEARYIGYVENNLNDAMQLLDSIASHHRDRQWFAVRIELIGKLKDQDIQAGRNKVAAHRQVEVEEYLEEYISRFREPFDNRKSSIPDVGKS